MSFNDAFKHMSEKLVYDLILLYASSENSFFFFKSSLNCHQSTGHSLGLFSFRQQLNYSHQIKAT